MKDLKEFLRDFEGNRVLMAVYPHPDDETMAAGGLLMVAKEMGYRTVVVCLTKGEAGQIQINRDGKKLAEIREEELRKVIKILRVDDLEAGDFGDAKLRENEEKWWGWVCGQIKKYQPGIVVTYDHSGNSGHPDHIVLSVVVLEIVKKMMPRPVLLWSGVLGIVKRKMVNKEVADFASKPDYYLDLGLLTLKKWKAAKCHRSQKLGKDIPIPLLILFLIFRREWYHQVDLVENYPYKFVPFKI